MTQVSPDAFAPGTRLAGARYLLKRKLGAGFLGELWLGWDRTLELEVALHLLPQHLARDPNLVESLKQQTESKLQLAHPNIVRTLGFVQDQNIAGIAVEHASGWSLAALKVDRPQKRYHLAELTPWIRQLCAALSYAHAERVLHLDLKPSNLLLDEREQLKVTGFGFAQVLRQFHVQPEANRLAESLGFLSPQQALGEKPSVLDDVYGLGAAIYDLLTGTPPFYKGQVLAQICERPPPTLRQRLEELGIQEPLPLVVEDTVALCLAKEPAKRPESVKGILELLERPSLPTPPPRTSPTVQPVGNEAAVPPASAMPRPQTPLNEDEMSPLTADTPFPLRTLWRRLAPWLTQIGARNLRKKALLLGAMVCLALLLALIAWPPN